MADKTQRTDKGSEIPIPKRKDFLKNLKKAATPKESTPNSPKKWHLEQVALTSSRRLDVSRELSTQDRSVSIS